MTHAAFEKPVPLRLLLNSDGCDLLREAWFGGKNADQARVRLFPPADDGPRYVVAQTPLHLVRPNEAGDLYDGTANRARVKAYVNEKIDAPVYLLFGARAVRLGAQHANVMDGGHRVSAARLRGDSSILSVMQEDHFHLLCLHAEKIERQRLIERSRLAQSCVLAAGLQKTLRP